MTTRGSAYLNPDSDFDREQIENLPMDAYVCHEDEGVVHVEYPTGYIVIGEGHVTGPYLTREQAEAELSDPAKQDPPHIVKPMYSGWIEPTDVVTKGVA